MSLVLSGHCLGVSVEIVNPPNGAAFESTTISVISGHGTDSRIDQVRTGRDFRKADLPKEGEPIALNVVVSAYAGRNGAGYRLTALSPVLEPAKG